MILPFIIRQTQEKSIQEQDQRFPGSVERKKEQKSQRESASVPAEQRAPENNGMDQKKQRNAEQKIHK